MIIDILQIVFSIMLIILVLLQNRGAGLGATFGGEGNIYRTKRGAEKIIFITTIIVAIAFLAISMANIIFQGRS
jgi:preprotein translocase subunit SecG